MEPGASAGRAPDPPGRGARVPQRSAVRGADVARVPHGGPGPRGPPLPPRRVRGSARGECAARRPAKVSAQLGKGSRQPGPSLLSAEGPGSPPGLEPNFFWTLWGQPAARAFKNCPSALGRQPLLPGGEVAGAGVVGGGAGGPGWGARPPGAGAWGGGPGPRRRRGADCRRSYLEEPLGWREMRSGPESNTGTTGES